MDGRVHKGDLRCHLGPVTIVRRTQLVVGQHLVGVGVEVGFKGVRVRVRRVRVRVTDGRLGWGYG